MQKGKGLSSRAAQPQGPLWLLGLTLNAWVSAPITFLISQGRTGLYLRLQMPTWTASVTPKIGLDHFLPALLGSSTMAVKQNLL